jgi:hypothetical protein
VLEQLRMTAYPQLRGHRVENVEWLVWTQTEKTVVRDVMEVRHWA